MSKKNLYFHENEAKKPVKTFFLADKPLFLKMGKARDVSYEMLGDAICHVLELALTCWLCKVNIKTAFRIIPVRPDLYKLLGAQGRFYCVPPGGTLEGNSVFGLVPF